MVSFYNLLTEVLLFPFYFDNLRIFCNFAPLLRHKRSRVMGN